MICLEVIGYCEHVSFRVNTSAQKNNVKEDLSGSKVQTEGVWVFCFTILDFSSFGFHFFPSRKIECMISIRIRIWVVPLFKRLCLLINTHEVTKRFLYQFAEICKQKEPQQHL